MTNIFLWKIKLQKGLKLWKKAPYKRFLESILNRYYQTGMDSKVLLPIYSVSSPI